MKRTYVVIIAIVVLFLSLNVGNSTAGEIQLTYANGYIPWTHKYSPGEVNGPITFCEIVNKNGAGKVKIDYYGSGQLFKDKDMTSAVPKGSVDMGMTVGSQWASIIPGQAVMELPFIFDDDEHFWRAFDGKVGQILAKEYEKNNVKLLGMMKNGPFVILTKEKPVTGASLKGLKLRVFGKVPALLTKPVGGSPVFMSSSEFVLALQRGTVDGLWTTPYGMTGFKLYELTKYAVYLPGTYCSFPIVINLAKWNSLPDDVKKILADAAQETMRRAKTEKWREHHAKEAMDIAVNKGGIKRHILTDKELAEWQEATKEDVKEEFLKMTGDLGKELLAAVEEVRK